MVAYRNRLQHLLFVCKAGANEFLRIVEHERHMALRTDRQRLLSVDIDHVIGVPFRIHGVGHAADPAVKLPTVWRRRLPIGHGREVRERRLLVTDAMDDGHVAVLVEALQARHGVLEAEMIVELAQPRRLDADAWPCTVVGVIPVGHHGVEAVITAGEFKHHQDTVLLRSERCRLGPGWSARESAERAKRKAAETCAQKIATRHAADARKHGCHVGLPCIALWYCACQFPGVIPAKAGIQYSSAWLGVTGSPAFAGDDTAI